jgi:galactosylceramidase
MRSKNGRKTSIPRSLGVLSQALFCLLICSAVSTGFAQTISVNGGDSGRDFEGVGGVSGGGATSVLLMSYPEPYRSQILDFLFKPQFGASMTTQFVEIGGDGNSTQSTEPSHMHSSTDENYQRGWEWWLIKEAKKRNQSITLDGVAWACPHWVGNGNFWTQDMCNYYVKWIKGLKTNYGFDLDAIGCKNESGENIPFVKMLRTTLDNAGLSKIMIHAFDNWGDGKFNFLSQFASDPALVKAVDIIGAHTTWISPWSETKIPLPPAGVNSGKRVWDTEEHLYSGPNPPGYMGFARALSIADAVNSNYIDLKITKTVFWYLIAAFYPIESYYNNSLGVASQPWSGNYVINPQLWGYAHYNQFVKVGWKFLNGACRPIGSSNADGTVVALKSPDNQDFSIIIETKGCTANKTMTFNISGGLPTTKTLCVWKSSAAAQFVKQADVTPSNGSFTLTIEPQTIYTISTTSGQQKGSFSTPVPAAKAFPLPYYETYDHYTDPKLWGYMPYYNVDLTGVFEIADRPDNTGKCLRQVLNQKSNSWATEWTPLSMLGDRSWTDYEVSADVYFDNGGWAGVMGRIGSPNAGYYLKLQPSGAWGLYATGSGSGTSLATGTATLSGQWHNVKLSFQGTTITGFIENKQVCSVTANKFSNGMAGLITGDPGGTRNTAMFDNLLINTVNGTLPQPTVFAQDSTPPYAPSVQVAVKPHRSGKVLLQLNTVYTQKGIELSFPFGVDKTVRVFDSRGKTVAAFTLKNGVPALLNYGVARTGVVYAAWEDDSGGHRITRLNMGR